MKISPRSTVAVPVVRPSLQCPGRIHSQLVHPHQGVEEPAGISGDRPSSCLEQGLAGGGGGGGVDGRFIDFEFCFIFI